MPPRGNPFARGTPAAPEFTMRATLDAGSPVKETELPTGVAKAQASLAEQIGALATDQFNRAEQETRTTAWEAGLVAGQERPGVQMEGGGRVYRDAFNRAASEIGLRQLEVSGRENLDRLAKEHATNPDAFGQAAQAYRDGTANELPPAVRVRYLVNYDAWARPYVNHVETQQQRFVRDQDLASLDAAMPLRMAARDAAARAAATDPRAADDLRREDETFRRDLIGRGPREAFTLDGVQYPADPTRTGSLKITELQRAWTHWTEGGRAQMVLGAFQAAPDKAQFLRDWEAQHMGSQRPAAGGASNATPGSAEDVAALRATAQRLGVSDVDLATLMSYETGGTMSPAKRGGRNNAHIGLIQFGANEQQTYGAHERQSFQEQLGAVERYLKDRGARPGDNLLTLYRIVNGGNRDVPVTASDGNGTIEGHVANMQSRGHVDRAQVFLGARPAQAPAGGAAPSDAMGPPAPAAVSGGALPFHEAASISRLLRSELSHAQQLQREAQQAERGRLDPLIQQNLVAAQQGAPPPHQIANDQYAAAGYDPAAKRTELSVQQHLYVAATDLAGADSVERTQQIADRFAVGSDLFMADPKAAGILLNHARQRGAQIQHETLVQRIADLTAEAEGTGARGSITPEEGMAGGMRPEQIQRVNDAISVKADYQRRFQDALRMAPAERAAAVAQLEIEGAGARENKMLLQAYAKASEAQAQALKADPAGFVVNMSKPAQMLMADATRDPEAMSQLLNLVQFEQQRLGVPEADRKPLPEALAKRLVADLAALPTDHDRLRRLTAFTATVQDDEHRSAIFGQLAGAGLKEPIIVGAAIARRSGEALGARITTELATDASKMGIDGTTRKNTLSAVQGVWDSDSRMGGLRRAQMLITGSAGFAQAGEHEQRLFEHVALVRQAGTGAYNAREIYGQLFGGKVAVNRPGDGVVVSAPEGINADMLTEGLRAERTARIAAMEPNPQRRSALERLGVWVDHGANRFALYAKDMGSPLSGADGKPITVSLDQVLITAQARTPATGAPDRSIRLQQRQQLRLGQEGAAGAAMTPVDLAP